MVASMLYEYAPFSMPCSKILFFPLFLCCLLLCSACAQGPRRADFILLPDSPPTAPQIENVNVALVLSGGGARGVAHAGVLEVLEKNHIPIDLIVGSSAGSVIGALYADDPNARHLKKKIIHLNKWDVLDLSWSHSLKMLWGLTGPVEGNAFKLFIQDNMKAQDFRELQIPLAVVTTDVDKGEPFVIQSGPIAPALHASSAIPMIFSPVHLYGKVLIDGCIASPVPVEIAKYFAPKLIIAVDVGTSPDYGSVKNVYQLAARSLHISYYKLSQWQTEQADIVIHPNIDSFGMFDDYANDKLYEEGKKAAQGALPQIQAALAKLNNA